MIKLPEFFPFDIRTDFNRFKLIDHHLLKKEIDQLPSLPGVYKYLDKVGNVLYVGKARDLRKRVLSYFTRRHSSDRVAMMISHIAFLETTVTRSEAEAFLLENNLIKAFKPRYNVLYRDDKSYPFLKLTKHRFPSILYYRGSFDRESYYFGPFPNASIVKESIRILQKVFHLRTCQDSIFNNRSRPCLLQSIGHCSAPCVKMISETDYISDVHNAIQFLLGNKNELMHQLQERMQIFSKELKFEHAARIRNQISALAGTLRQQVIETIDEENTDILAFIKKDNHICINLAMVRSGRHLGDKAYFFNYEHSMSDISFEKEKVDSSVKQKAEHMCFDRKLGSRYIRNDQLNFPILKESKSHSWKECSFKFSVIEAFIYRHYAGRYIPKVLIINQKPIDQRLVDFLFQQAGYHVKLIFRPKKKQRIWLAMAKQNAQLALDRYLNRINLQEDRARDLVDKLKIKLSEDNLSSLRIESFDVSHAMGEAMQAACVVYHHCKLQKAEYRRYNIRDVVGGDDCAAMYQALSRHYKFCISKQNKEDFTKLGMMHPRLDMNQTEDEKNLKMNPILPHVVLIDGGEDQVEVARKVFIQIGLDISTIVGVSKAKGRKIGLEKLIFADEREPLKLGKSSLALMLIAQIRDEAHRFAINGMRKQRLKTRQRSKLEEIKGVGPNRRRNLLMRFGGLQGVKEASVDELISVKGISYKLATQVYQKLHEKNTTILHSTLLIVFFLLARFYF